MKKLYVIGFGASINLYLVALFRVTGIGAFGDDVRDGTWLAIRSFVTLMKSCWDPIDAW